MVRKIQICKAQKHDARFMAAMDKYEYTGDDPSQYFEIRKQLWTNRINEISIHDHISVARDGGLYLAYFAMFQTLPNSHVLNVEMRIGPCVKDKQDIFTQLLQNAGVSIEYSSMVSEINNQGCLNDNIKL